MVEFPHVGEQHRIKLKVLYFADPTLNTVSKSAIFEFSGVGGGGGGGGRYYADPTLNTVSKSAIFEFSGVGLGYFANPT